ncbi:MAG: hypothetical protein EP330_14050 [Deltaproteobacteria bacterium]|nr:MAG: hypothetical protein EP330_14050 [Deltaproteobacteria bacterium]
MRPTSAALVLTLACVGACSDAPVDSGVDTSADSWRDESFVAGRASFDLLIVVDRSGHDQEVAPLSAAMPALISALDDQAVDWQIGVTNVSPDPTDAGELEGPFVRAGNSATPAEDVVGQIDGMVPYSDEQPFAVSQIALGEALLSGANAGFRREGGRLAILSIGNEDDQSTVGVDAFASWVDELEPDAAMTSFSAITGPEEGLFPCNGDLVSAEPTPRLHAVVAATGGVLMDYCALDWVAGFAELGALGVGVQQVFPLAEAADGASLEVHVAEQAVAERASDGFTWDAGRAAVVLHGTAVPEVGDVVSVRYRTP